MIDDKDKKTVHVRIADLDVLTDLTSLGRQVNDLLDRQSKGEFFGANVRRVRSSFDYDIEYDVVEAYRLETDGEFFERMSTEESSIKQKIESKSKVESLERKEYERLKKKFDGGRQR